MRLYSRGDQRGAMTRKTHSIRVSHTRMNFSAAHFVVSCGECESIHGHNYVVEVSVEGPLDEHGMVEDFRTLRERVAEVCRPLDHKMILPTGSPDIRIEDAGDTLIINAGMKRYMIPSVDCIMLPISATTAELLAEYIAGQLKVKSGYTVRVCVQENVVSTGCCQIIPDSQ